MAEKGSDKDRSAVQSLGKAVKLEPGVEETTTDRQGQPSTSQPAKASGQTKRKFTPKAVPRAKHAAKEAEAAVKTEDDTFKNLAQLAQDPTAWDRKGRGRGRRGGARVQGKVAFGGAQSSGFGTARTSGETAARHQKYPSGRAGNQGGEPGSGSGQGRLLRADGAAVKNDFKGISGEVESDEDILDYNVYYPTVLPNRVPGAQLDPEFETTAAVIPPDLTAENEEVPNLAEALGLLDLEEEERSPVFLFQFPQTLPIPVHTASNKSKRPAPGSRNETVAAPLEDLKAGKLGKLLVFESGAVKLQLGEVLMDLNVGEESQAAQEILALSVEGRSAVSMGDVDRRIVCTPDVDQLLSDTPIPDWQRSVKAAPAAEAKVKKEEVLSDAEMKESKENVKLEPTSTDEAKSKDMMQ